MTQLSTWLARHLQTLLGSLGRLAAHPAATGMTVAVIGIALALPLLFLVLLANIRGATAGWNQAFDLSVYVTAAPGSARAQALAKTLRARPDVAAVRLVTADEGLAQFRASSGFGSALDALGDNPLPDTLVVTPTIAASNAGGTEAIKNAMTGIPGVQSVALDTEWVARLQTILEILNRIAWLVGALLGLGVSLVIGNTIRLDILNRRDEIEVLKLVGASDGFTRRPFLYTGIWYGLGGGVLAVTVVTFAVALLRGPAERLAGLYGSQLHVVGLKWGAAITLIAGAAILGWLGSWLVANRHIRAINPT